MEVSVTPLENSKSQLEVSLTAEEVQGVIDSTYQSIAQRVRVPGFRPGKAPRQLIMRTYGEEDFYHRATDEVLQKWFPRALAQSEVEALDDGEVDLSGDGHDHVSPGEPFEFKATVTVKPEVNLPDYGEIHIPAPPTNVTQFDVEDVIDRVRTARATLEPAPARAAEIGDVVKMNISGKSQGKDVLTDDDFQFELTNEAEAPDAILPGLSKELAGARPGDIREITLELPADYREPELAGHGLSLKIVVKEILRKILPELNDEFAAEASTAKTVDEMKEMVRHNLELEKLHEARNQVATDIVDSLIARSNVPAPEVLVEEELQRTMRRLRQSMEREGVNYERFLMAIGKSEDEYVADLLPAAERRVKRDLILEAVAKAENLEPDKGVADAEVGRTAAALGRNALEVEQYAQSPRIRATIEGEMKQRMALDLLVERVSGLKPAEHDHDHQHDHGDQPLPAPESPLVVEPEETEAAMAGQTAE